MKFSPELYIDLIGKPFRGTKEVFDGTKYNCWDLVRTVYSRMGIELPNPEIKCHEVLYLAHLVREEKEGLGDMLIPIDITKTYPIPAPALLLFNPEGDRTTHVGLFIGGGRFLHATDTDGRGVCIENTYSPLWKGRIEGYYIVRGSVE